MFGLTPEDLDALIASQGGVCAICRDAEPEHIDHDHESGQIRGVLCGPCNMGLGLFKDQPVRLRAAAAYLKRAQGGQLARVVEEYEPSGDYVFEIGQDYPHAA
jgi:hypothetical protein